MKVDITLEQLDIVRHHLARKRWTLMDEIGERAVSQARIKCKQRDIRAIELMIAEIEERFVGTRYDRLGG